MFLFEWDQLLLAARDGDARALGRLIEMASEDLRATTAGALGRVTRARVHVEEVFADTLVRVLTEIGGLRAANYLGFRCWFASIARNHARGRLRTARRRQGLPDDEVPDAGANGDAKTAPEGQDLMRDAVVRLSRNQQVAFVLREGLALAWPTIGFVLDRREGPAARLVHYRAAVRVKSIAVSRPERGLAALIDAPPL